jgi:hypothetical protein
MHKRVAVVMFCGPLLESGNYETLRITSAIKCALDTRSPLYIIGGMHQSSAITLYQSMAKEHGLTSIHILLASDQKTMTYATCLVDALKNDAPHVTEIYLVTSDWHMMSAYAMLTHLLRKRCMPVVTNKIEAKSILKPSQLELDGCSRELNEFGRKEGNIIFPAVMQTTP